MWNSRDIGTVYRFWIRRPWWLSWFINNFLRLMFTSNSIYSRLNIFIRNNYPQRPIPLKTCWKRVKLPESVTKKSYYFPLSMVNYRIQKFCKMSFFCIKWDFKYKGMWWWNKKNKKTLLVGISYPLIHVFSNLMCKQELFVHTVLQQPIYLYF